MALANDLRHRHGVVLIRDHYFNAPDGRECTGVYGKVEVVPAVDALGFEVSSRDSNWLVVVRGESEIVVLPGCAVLGFNYSGDTVFPGKNYYVVR